MSLRDPLRIGVVAAALIAGPPLYGSVNAGGMDVGTALTYGVVVAVAATVAASFVFRIVAHYSVEQDRRAREEQAEEAREAAEAARAAAAAASAAGAPQPPPSDVR